MCLTQTEQSEGKKGMIKFMEKRPIIVMVAMEYEMNFLLEKLENRKYEKINKYEFYEGTINDYPIVVCHCHVMSFNATIATTIAITKYNPIAIISQGCSGAHTKDIRKNDIIIGEKCVNIVSSKTPHKKENEGSNSLDWELVSFIENADDKLQYQTADKNLIELCKTIPFSKGKIYFGTLGSGDVWNNETDRILHLHEKYGTLCEDMESIAVYYTANTFNIPVIGIRIISNNEVIGDVYAKDFELISQEFTYELILKIIEREV